MSGRTATATGAGVLLVAAALTSGVIRLDLPATTPPTTVPLSATLGEPVLTCPGPETLAVPRGGTAQNPGGAVVVSAVMAGSATATGRIQLDGASSPLAARAARALPLGTTRLPTGLGLDLDLAVAVGKLDPGDVTVTGALALGGLGPVRVAARSAGAPDPAADPVTDPGADPLAAGSRPPLLGAVQSTLARGGDLRGLTATGCGAPAAQTWLVGGGTQPGRRLRLLLSNPSATPAVADIEVFGPRGRVEAPAGDGVAVPARGLVPLFVDALAPGLDQVVVHVTARSGRLRATLHDSLLRGLRPGGTDDVSGSAAPAVRQVVPGVSLVNGFGKGADDPRAAGSTAIRVAVPGAEEAVVRVRLVNSAGTVQLPRGAVRNVPAGSVVDIPVAGVPSGTYTAVVDADVPVVAGALVGRRGGKGRTAAAEFAWARAGTGLTGGGVLALPPGAESTLSIAPLGAGGSLVVTRIDGLGRLSPPQQVTVAEGTAATVQLPPGTAGVRIGDLRDGQLVASLVATVPDRRRGTMISVLPVELTEVVGSRSVGAPDGRLGVR